MIVYKDKTKPRFYWPMLLTGTSAATVLLAGIFAFTEVGSAMASWMKVMLVAVVCLGTLTWGYRKRPIRDRRKAN